jgi:hypothetical protein
MVRMVGRRARLSLYSSTTTLGAQGGVLLLATDPLVELDLRSWAGRKSTGVEGHKHRVQSWGGRLTGAAAGRSHGALADASGLRAGIPSPWRAKALRSDGQVAPSSAAAAFTLPSRVREMEITPGAKVLVRSAANEFLPCRATTGSDGLDACPAGPGLLGGDPRSAGPGTRLVARVGHRGRNPRSGPCSGRTPPEHHGHRGS